MSDQPQIEDRRGVLGWVLRHPKTTIALVLLVMAILILLALQRTAENALARRIAAIKAKGEPTSVADLIARQRHIPDEENMLLAVVKPAEKMVKADFPGDRDAHLRYVGMAKRTPTGQRWSNDELEAAHWYLQRFAPEIASIHAGLRLKDSVYNVRWNTPAINAPMPELAYVRHVSKVLQLETLTTANDSDGEKTERFLLEALPVVHALQGDLPLIGALVELAVKALVLDGIERSINQIGLSDAALQSADRWLRETERSPEMGAATRVERATQLDSYRWLYSTNWTRFVPVLQENDVASAVELQTMFVDAVNAPYGVLQARIAAIDSRADSLPREYNVSHNLIPIITGSYLRSLVLWTRGVGENRAMCGAIACERFRLASGKWPETLAQLIPAYLDSVPIDPIDGKPIRYAIIPEGIKTWTIAGDDHDEDNGGDVRRLEPYDEKFKPKDFGWVILNPELRGRAAPQTESAEK